MMEALSNSPLFFNKDLTKKNSKEMKWKVYYVKNTYPMKKFRKI